MLARSQETASQLTALRGVHERLQRDKGSLEAELAALREDFTRPGGAWANVLAERAAWGLMRRRGGSGSAAQ